MKNKFDTLKDKLNALTEAVHIAINQLAIIRGADSQLAFAKGQIDALQAQSLREELADPGLARCQDPAVALTDPAPADPGTAVLVNSPRRLIRGSSGASGFDLPVRIGVHLCPNKTARIPTGVRVQIAKGYEGQVRPRSSASARGLLVHFGTIDRDFRGEIEVVVTNLSGEWITIDKPIAQLVICPVARPRFEPSHHVVITSDEDGGFVAECPGIPGCISQGETREEAMTNIKEAIELCVEADAAITATAPRPANIDHDGHIVIRYHGPPMSRGTDGDGGFGSSDVVASGGYSGCCGKGGA